MNMHERMSGQQPAGPVDAPEPRQHGRRRRLIVIAVLVLVALAAALFFLLPSGEPAAEAPADTADTAPRVTVVDVASRPVTANVRVTGSVAPVRDLPVGVQGQGGQVVAVTVVEGDYVRRGQVLARIDKSVQVQQVAQLGAAVERARADLKLAESELERAEALVDRGFISQADIERRTATRDGAAAQVNVAAAQLREAQARLEQLDIRAPESGLILERNVEPGQVVSSGTPAVFRIAQDGQMELRAQVAEQDLQALDVGQGAEIRVVGSDEVLRGTVTLVDPIIESASRQGTARVGIQEDGKVRPGAFATAIVETGTANRPMLPESAVLGNVDESFVYVLDAENRVARRAVTIGDVSDRGVVILSGLEDGDRVVESAGAFLNEGDRIEPVALETGARE
ncbi:efflux transporter periplasmic adaptor subunit [Pacificimonas flava]|uniref:Efflux transporter periplasmic adaptor subunit n=2 Tax=Pacificimonas TaxID=1960290 RepID=A0A219B4Y0_9SPHN|nr:MULTISPECIES: efflux RND transporter periplasmic adaptor subunit [Pacificimonas]MBZ6377062.1 efflux RND transporter periplasmic adaptor subunit [Pacificimonas aurantium]OWV33203.1 efflux transporter periplasmic adaptor subunit [Pacificimonas flava]